MKKLFDLFVSIWKTENTGDEIRAANVDLIVPISYTTLRSELTDATIANVKRAIKYCLEDFPNSACVAFSSCSYLFQDAARVEDGFRNGLCHDAGIEPIVAKSMINTVDEAMNIRDALDARGIRPKCLLIVTGELHSPSARYIWEKLFPEARVLIACIPCELEIQPNHLVLDQRKMWKWVLSNIKREVALRILPFPIIRKIQHKAAH